MQNRIANAEDYEGFVFRRKMRRVFNTLKLGHESNARPRRVIIPRRLHHHFLTTCCKRRLVLAFTTRPVRLHQHPYKESTPREHAETGKQHPPRLYDRRSVRGGVWRLPTHGAEVDFKV